MRAKRTAAGAFAGARTKKAPAPPKPLTLTADPAFERLWAVYPRKIEKGSALKRYSQVVTSVDDAAGLLEAASRYAAYCRRHSLNESGIKHLSTFIENRESKPYVQPWRDWVGSVIETRQQSYAEIFAKVREEERA